MNRCVVFRIHGPDAMDFCTIECAAIQKGLRIVPSPVVAFGGCLRPDASAEKMWSGARVVGSSRRRVTFQRNDEEILASHGPCRAREVMQKELQQAVRADDGKLIHPTVSPLTMTTVSLQLAESEEVSVFESWEVNREYIAVDQRTCLAAKWTDYNRNRPICASHTFALEVIPILEANP